MENRRTNTVLIALLTLFAAVTVECEGPAGNASVAGHAKAVDVATLDPALPSQQLEHWLLTGAPHLQKVDWLVGDCGTKPEGPEPEGGWPLCVRLQMRRQEVWGYAFLTVGTIRGGVHGAPRLDRMIFTSRTLALQGKFWEVAKLSDLPLVLSEIDEADKQARK